MRFPTDCEPGSASRNGGGSFVAVGVGVADGGAGVSVSSGAIVVAGGGFVGVAVSGRVVAGTVVMVAVDGGDISAAGLQANNKDIRNTIITSGLKVFMSISKIFQHIEPEFQLRFLQTTVTLFFLLVLGSSIYM
jgi:hypothetical protein